MPWTLKESDDFNATGIGPKGEMHVDVWLRAPVTVWNQKENYAKFFLDFKRTPAMFQSEYRQFMEPFKLFAFYDGKWWRCTGASRLGDIYLAKDMTQEYGYDERGVYPNQIVAWAREAPKK